MSPDELWAQKYAARHAEELAKEEARREQAFLDVPLLVAGEPLRAMTPYDLLLLNGAESPFVCAGDMTAEHVAMFYWVQHAENDRSDTWRNRRTRDRLVKRLASRQYLELVAAGRDYVEETFLDAPRGATTADRRPLGTCFLAPLVVNLALATGWSQAEIMGTPLPRLFQYFKAIRAKNEGKEFVDTSPSDRITGDFLSELNELINARN